MSPLEPTDAMVEASRGALWASWGAPRQTTDWPSRGQLSDALTAAFATAPSDWLLRAALSENEMYALANGVRHSDPALSAHAKLSRALRGGEETKEVIVEGMPWPESEPTAKACGRLLVGQGTDTWDPLCGRAVGHTGACVPEVPDV